MPLNRTIQITAIMLLVSCFFSEAAVVEKISIEGNTVTSERVIRKNIRTREGEVFLDHVLNEDIRRLYGLERFEKVEVKREQRGDRVIIAIIIKEKTVIRERLFSGNKKLKASRFDEEVKSAPGKRYDLGEAEMDERTISRVYRENGYLTAEVKHEVNKVPGKEGEADVVFRIRENGQVKIGGIDFKGNSHVPPDRLRKLMETKIDRFYNKGVYDADVFQGDLRKIESFYQTLGYLDVKAEPGESRFSENRKWLYLEVSVKEGPLYILDRLELRGNKVISTEGLMNRLSWKVGMPFSEYARLETEDALEKCYGEIGRIFTNVRSRTIVDEKSSHVAVEVDIEEGKEVFVEKVKIFGNVKTRDVVIRRELVFFPTERVNTFLIKESQKNLQNLGFFDKVEILPEPGSKPHLANIVVTVSEKQTGSINFSIGFSSVESIFAMLKYTQRNFDWRNTERGTGGFFTGEGFIGDGQSLEVAINTGTRSRRFTVDFNEPWVFNRKIRLGFGLFHTESSIARDFDEIRTGAYTRVGKEFLKNLEGYLTYTVSGIDISGIGEGVSPAIKEQEGYNLISSVKNDWIYDGTDSRFLPTSGHYWRISETLAGGPFGGTRDFYKLDAELKAYRKLYAASEKEAHVLSSRLETGYAGSFLDTESVPIFDRYFVGGLGTVRGFENRSLGPRIGSFEVGGEFTTVFNLEYGYPISEDVFRGVVFYDQGYAWEDIGDFKFGDMRSSVGLGLRIQVEVLGPFPISVDFAKPVRRKAGDLTETFSFNFGNFF